MIARVKVGQNKRLLVERRVNQYKVVGPGWVWLIAGQQPLTTLYIGPQDQSFTFNEVQTVGKIPVDVTIQVLYHIDPKLFTEELLPNVPSLNERGWQYTLKWQVEYVLRQLLADYTWRDLARQEIKQRLERQLAQILADRLKIIGLNITAVCLIKTELPSTLQQTLIQAEQDGIEAWGRATVLKEYFEIFGDNLPQAMSYIIQWELLNMLHKNGNSQLLLTAFNLSPDTPIPNPELPPAIFQMRLPMSQEGQQR